MFRLISRTRTLFAAILLALTVARIIAHAQRGTGHL